MEEIGSRSASLSLSTDRYGDPPEMFHSLQRIIALKHFDNYQVRLLLEVFNKVFASLSINTLIVKNIYQKQNTYINVGMISTYYHKYNKKKRTIIVGKKQTAERN